MMTTGLKEKYQKEVVPHLKKERELDNALRVPRLEKVVINMGVGKLASQTPQFEEKLLPNLMNDLAQLAGQRPAPTRARKSIAGFKLRQGQVSGLKVTLRGRRMYDFLDRFINVALPRVRDFRGIPLRNFDPKGNLNYGIREYTVFPEIAAESVKVVATLEVTAVTTARRREDSIALFRALGFPLQKTED